MNDTKKFVKKLLKESKEIPKNPLNNKQEERDIDMFEDKNSKLTMDVFSLFSVILSMSLLYTIHITYSNILWSLILGVILLLLVSLNEKHKRKSIIDYFKWKFSKNRTLKHNTTKMVVTVCFSFFMALIGVFMFLFQKENNIESTQNNIEANIIRKYDSLLVIKNDSINNLIENSESYIKSKNKTIVENINTINDFIDDLNNNYKSSSRYKRNSVEQNKIIGEKKEEVIRLKNNITNRTDARIEKLEKESLVLENKINSKRKYELNEYKNSKSKESDKNNKLNYFLLFITIIVESVIIYSGYNYSKNYNNFLNELDNYKNYFQNHPLMKELKNTMLFLDRLYLNYSKGSTVPNQFLKQMMEQYELKVNVVEMTNLMKSLKIYVQDGKSKKIMIEKNVAVENTYEIYVPLLEKEIND